MAAPAIRDAERESALRHLPPMVYVPVTRFSGAGPTEIQLRQLSDGRIALLAYTALDRLARCLGDGQPWILVEMAQLAEVKKTTRHDLVLFDPVVRPRVPADDATPEEKARYVAASYEYLQARTRLDKYLEGQDFAAQVYQRLAEGSRSTWSRRPSATPATRWRRTCTRPSPR